MLPNDTYVTLSICTSVVDYTCIKSVRKYSKFIRLKYEVPKDSFRETAQFWTRYMDIIQMVLTLIRATRKTT